MDSEAFKRQLSFKDALLNKYSLEEDDEELCFIHISGSPKHKGKQSLGFNKKVFWGQFLVSFQTYYTVPKFLKVFIIRLNKMPTATVVLKELFNSKSHWFTDTLLKLAIKFIA